MKKLIIPLLFICGLISAQEYQEYVLFDISGVTSDTTRPISYKPDEPGALIEIDFTSVNCNVLTLDVGYSSTDRSPVYLDTIPNISLPITLDKTTYTNTYLGVESNVFVIDILDYKKNYLWFHIGYDGACTRGQVKLRLPN